MAKFIGGEATHHERQSGGEVPVLRSTYQPKYPQYQLEEDRERTFIGWESSLKSDKLVLAGFFSKGDGDKTCCFYCGKTFGNWTKHDDPFKEHASYSDCAFLRMTFGEKKIRIATRISREPEAGGEDYLFRDAEVCSEKTETVEELKILLERERTEKAELGAEHGDIIERQSELIKRQSEEITGLKASVDAERRRAIDAETRSEAYKLKTKLLKVKHPRDQEMNKQVAELAMEQNGYSSQQIADARAKFADRHGDSAYLGKDLAMIVEKPDPLLSNMAGAGRYESSPGQQLSDGEQEIAEATSGLNDIPGGRFNSAEDNGAEGKA